jgi:hypothetical protein
MSTYPTFRRFLAARYTPYRHQLHAGAEPCVAVDGTMRDLCAELLDWIATEPAHPSHARELADVMRSAVEDGAGRDYVVAFPALAWED